MFDIVPFKRRSSIARMFDELDVFKDDFFKSKILNFNTDIIADIVDDSKNYVIEADLPGFSKDDISVEISGNVLTISAKRDNVIDEKNESYIRRERSYGEVTRSFRLDNIKDDQINASFKDGVLKLVLPKLQQQKANTKKVDIN